ncbi:hypothetical protein ACHAPJ_007731 [Fusarium lateritium]
MFSLRPLESGCPSFIVQPAPDRPTQTGKLALLPTEIIVMIAENINGPRINVRQDLKSLALSSAKLFDTVRPIFYCSRHYHDFHQALLEADVQKMERCHEFGALDTDHFWNLKKRQCQCKDNKMEHRVHRPVDVLLESLSNTSWKLNHTYGLMWLYSKGYSVRNWWNFMKVPGSPNLMPEVLLNLLQSGSSRHEAEGLCGMIRFLSDQGLPMPLWVDPDRSPAFDDKEEPQDDFNPGNTWHYLTMQIALRSHCPPMVLEILLQEFARRNFFLTSCAMDTMEAPPELKDWFDAQPPAEGYDGSPWFIEDDIDDVISGLYADLMDPSGWNEEYKGETVAIWEAKLNLLVRYRALDEFEHAVFVGILDALREIAKMDKPHPSTMANDEKIRWVALCKSVQVFANMPELHPSEGWFEPEFPEKIRRPHRFVIHQEWNPWKDWYLSRVRKDFWEKSLDEHEGDWDKFEELLDEDGSWTELLDHADSDQLFPWYQTDYGWWEAAVESLSDKDSQVSDSSDSG